MMVQEKAIETSVGFFHVEKSSGHKATYYITQIRYKVIDTGMNIGKDSFGNKIKQVIPASYKADDPELFKRDSGKWLRSALAISLNAAIENPI